MNMGHNRWKLFLYTYTAFIFKKEAVLSTCLKAYQIDSLSTTVHGVKRQIVIKEKPKP